MKIEIGKYYTNGFDIIKIMKKSTNPLIKNAYDVRRADDDGIGWSTISVNIIKEEYNEIENKKDLQGLKIIFDADPNSRL